MRRTRHVVLPVKSWQYIGLMVVSLACLTLGLVSRDREGKSGSLTGPELEHNAPHKVDACPNLLPFVLDPTSTFMLNGKTSGTNSNSPTDQLQKTPQEKLASTAREVVANNRRLINHRSRDVRNIRTIVENRRLTRSDDRSTRSSRSVSLNQRISNTIRTRESSTRRESEAARLHDRRVRDMRSTERQNRESRLIDTRRLNSRSLDRVSARVTADRLTRSIRESRDRRSTERQENRINISERRIQTRSRTVAQSSPESRLLARSRLERTIDNFRERRSTERRENQNVDRRQRQVDRLARLNHQERKSIEYRNQRSRVSDVNERIWVDSLRRNTRSAPLDINRNHYQRTTRNTSRDRKRETLNERQSRLENRFDERTSRINERRTNYLMSMPKLPSAKQTLDVGKYEFLRQTFVLTLGAIYATSLIQGKNGFLRNILNQANRLTVW